VGPSTRLIVCDTNIHIHSHMFPGIPWASMLAVERVRLTVPLVVIDELDDIKRRASKDGRRAQKVLKRINDAIGRLDGEQVATINPTMDLQLLIEPPGYSRLESNDDEIVRQTAYLDRVTEGRATLVSADIGMQIRAVAASVNQFAMPVQYKRGQLASGGANV